ncbi:MAG: pyridoxamine 5'-phosphate oxidase family protein [Candidatus Thermoplasmatota archaeon]|jgi:nitroimidazol reductase NimA-like FMN-containing flavoprotein (pyridoxamine 5'-phosphate oxidase superfamily)|nr:pyridoxamine 5'-phosphate oxidase family protein [Candidatus Thermoplasmatota archaeon]MCL5681373.1 pyridoxamine 5'-phosphate oxidase family protein [Candidatus Thermoplasmatota archaeon]
MDIPARSKINRYPNRGNYDINKLQEILDRNFVCQVAFEEEGQPFVIPMNFSHDPGHLYLHGSKESRIMSRMTNGKQLAISILEVNGIVIRRRMADNSLLYVSAVLYGKGSEINDYESKMRTFKLLMDKMVPGRWEETERPDNRDMEKVMVVQFDIEDFSIKINENNVRETGGRTDLWYGIIPIKRTYGEPIAPSEIPVPDYIRKLITIKSA